MWQEAKFFFSSVDLVSNVPTVASAKSKKRTSKPKNQISNTHSITPVTMYPQQAPQTFPHQAFFQQQQQMFQPHHMMMGMMGMMSGMMMSMGMMNPMMSGLQQSQPQQQSMPMYQHGQIQQQYQSIQQPQQVLHTQPSMIVNNNTNSTYQCKLLQDDYDQIDDYAGYDKDEMDGYHEETSDEEEENDHERNEMAPQFTTTQSYNQQASEFSTQPSNGASL